MNKPISRMKWFALSVVCVLTLLSPALAGQLEDDIKAALADKVLARADVGVRIVRLGATPAQSQVIYEQNAATPLIPASNLKLITTAAALDGLGAEFKFKTLLAGKGDQLAVIGDGDPTLGDAELLKKVGWDTLTVFKAWAGVLREKKINSAGTLLVDDGIFEQLFQHPNWPPNQADRRYMAGVAGLNLNVNCIDVTVSSNGFGQVMRYAVNPPTAYVQIRNSCTHGSKNAIVLSRDPGSNTIKLAGESRGTTTEPISVNIEDPALFAGTVLAETLRSAGVQVGEIRRERTVREQLGNGWSVLAVHETPIAMVLARANKDSQNVYAEALAKRLAYEVSKPGANGQKPPADWKSAAAAMSAFVRSTGVADNQFIFDDGSGLSKQNSITPAAMTHVLSHQFFSKHRETYLATLAIAGVDGTLDDRFRGSDLRGRVYAKSGFVEGVSALSGYFKAKDEQWYAFSILMNGIPKLSNSSVKPIQEKIVIAVDNSTRR